MSVITHTERYAEISGNDDFWSIRAEVGEDSIIITQSDDSCIYVPKTHWRELVRDINQLIKLEGSK